MVRHSSYEIVEHPTKLKIPILVYAQRYKSLEGTAFVSRVFLSYE